MNITLYHYSNKDFNGYINPSYFGESSFTSFSKDLSGFKRSYFYINKNRKEYFFNSARFLYITDVKLSKIYDLVFDKLNCINKFNNNTDFFLYLKSKGYKGFIDTNNGIGVVCLFNKIKIKDKITLTS